MRSPAHNSWPSWWRMPIGVATGLRSSPRAGGRKPCGAADRGQLPAPGRHPAPGSGGQAVAGRECGEGGNQEGEERGADLQRWRSGDAAWAEEREQALDDHKLDIATEIDSQLITAVDVL